MNGIEAIKAMMNGKTVEVTEGFSEVHEGMRYRMNSNEILVRADSGIPSTARMNSILTSKFEIVPEYPLNFFEAMEALNEGKTVKNESYSDTHCKKNEDGRIVYDNGTHDAYFEKDELNAKWKIVGE